MNISCTVYEGRWESPCIEVAQKIAVYSAIPMAFILFFEAVVKNMIFINLANVVITVIHSIDHFFTKKGYTK